MDVQGIPLQLADWLDDICVRFIVNLPREELESVERIIFQVEEGHWYYEDFIRPLDQSLPSLTLRQFCYLVFQYCPLLTQFSDYHAAAFTEFLAYKTRVPVRGAIMVDANMEQVVLVKGWKKGSKWSFPRGKINKDEDDLDCAVRETYEETGYDVRSAGLIDDDESAKYIEVTLREQQMRLYVFRGVPLDTYFEPRTRKEISKIEWYKISDLPGGKRQVYVKTDDLQHNKFYMVAPFIGQLKGWIKQQRRNDRTKSGLNAPEPVLVEDSGFETDYPTHDGLIAADAPELADNVNAGDGHLQFLLSRLGQPQTETPQPHPSAASSAKTDQLAVELKKLLSVGSVASTAAPVKQPPQTKPRGNSLMSLLQPGGAQAHPPQTPIEKIETSPPQALTPHHHNKPPHISELSPPPQFPFSAVSDNMNRPRHTFSFADTSAHVYNAPQQQHLPPFPPTHPSHPPHVVHPHPSHAPHAPHHAHQNHPAQRAAPFVAPQPFPASVHPQQQFMAHQHAAPLTQPTLPPAVTQFNQRGVQPTSNLSGPRLNPHNIALLNTFKSAAQNPQPLAVSPVTHSLELPTENADPLRRDRAPESVTTAPAQHAPQLAQNSTNGVNGQAPRTVQQKTLLGLFRNPATAQATSSSDGLAPPVAELSAGTPQNSVDQSPSNQVTVQKIQEHITISRDGTTKTKTKLTSATISGPLNAPDFDTVQRNRPPAELGNGSENAQSPVPVHTVDSTMVIEAPRPFHPSTILQRQQQFTPTNLGGPPSEPPPPSSVLASTFDRRDAQPASQKSTLMSLFGAAGPKQAGVMLPGPMSAPRHPSLNGSPVSPLPDRRVPVRSQPTSIDSAQAEKTKNRVVSLDTEGRGQGSAKNQSPITPVEKRFLFQYLEGVVNQETKD